VERVAINKRLTNSIEMFLLMGALFPKEKGPTALFLQLSDTAFS
jgi:hypothetical protein